MQLPEKAAQAANWSKASYRAASEYLERLAAAEFQAALAVWRQKDKRRPLPKGRSIYSPTPYHAELVRLLGQAGGEEAFKALKALEGYASALGL